MGTPDNLNPLAQLRTIAAYVLKEHGMSKAGYAEGVRRIFEESGLTKSAIKVIKENTLVYTIVCNALKDEVDRAKMAARQAIAKECPKYMPKVYSKEFTEGVYKLGAFLNYPLDDGTPLWKANKDQVTRQISIYMSNVQGNLHKAFFLRKVLAAVGDEKEVGKVFNGQDGNDKLKAIYEEAATEAAEQLVSIPPNTAKKK